MPTRRKRTLSVDAEFDRRMMAGALRLGRRNLGQSGRNPAVGCIIVGTKGEDRIVVGRGWTAIGGRPHAEKAALAVAGSSAKGAVAYVTLEPCAHRQRGGSCAAALIEAGVARVVTAMADPDPRTSGKGHAALAEAGIAVTTDVLAGEASRAHSGHICRITKGRPHVTLKLAVSADGMIGKREGERMIISGKATFDMVHVMRTAFDAIMVGIGTALVDDPLLTVRQVRRERPLTRVLFDRRLRISPSARLFSTLDAGPVIIVTTPEGMAHAPSRASELEQAGARLEPIAHGALHEAFGRLAAVEVMSLLLEGGVALQTAVWEAGLVDAVHLYIAPVTIGDHGVAWLDTHALVVGALADRRVTRCGPDVFVEGYVHGID